MIINMSGKIRPKHSSLTAQLQYDFIPGPVKIKDGLFMGDEIAAKDVEFIITNKVTHIINTVSRRIPNIWERIGVQYLSLNWSENEQNVFDKKNTTVNAIFGFIEDAMEDGKSCLVHSVNAKSRSFVVVAAYLMKKYNWSLQKTLDFVGSKKEKLEVREAFYDQLKELQVRLSKSVPLSDDWQQAKNEEQLVLNNTYKNSKVIQYKEPPPATKTKKKVGWLDSDTKHTTKYVQQRNLYRQAIPNRLYNGKLKSILKGSSEANPQVSVKPQQTPSEQPVGTHYMHHGKHQGIELQTNNFMSPEDGKQQMAAKKIQNPLMTRPYSSDTKERQRKKQAQKDPKKITYDPMLTNFRSPYQTKLQVKTLGSKARHTVNGSLRKEQEVYKPVTSHFERPQSASNTEKRKVRGSYNPYKDEFLITNSKPVPVRLGGSSMIPREQQNLANGSQLREKWRGF